MTNSEKYLKAFIKTFAVDENQAKTLTYRSIADWDSMGHMQLIAAIENTFDIMMDADDIIDFDSYEKGKELLGKYDVEFD